MLCDFWFPSHFGASLLGWGKSVPIQCDKGLDVSVLSTVPPLDPTGMAAQPLPCLSAFPPPSHQRPRGCGLCACLCFCSMPLPPRARAGRGARRCARAAECRKLISRRLGEHGEALRRPRGIRGAHGPHRGIPVPLQNARVNGGRKISRNMAFCDRREIAKGRKIKKGSVFLSLPFPAMLERLRKCPAIRNNVQKSRHCFPW